MTIQLAKLDEDFWELISAEERAKASKSFEIPSFEERESLVVGRAAQLLFNIEYDDKGFVRNQIERMWVIVAERSPPFYVGRLISQPSCVVPEDEFYLSFNSEVPFQSIHVIDIQEPPAEFLAIVFGSEPTNVWPR